MKTIWPLLTLLSIVVFAAETKIEPITFSTNITVPAIADNIHQVLNQHFQHQLDRFNHYPAEQVLNQVNRLVSQATEPYGYFSPRTSHTLSTRDHTLHVHLTIELGPPTQIQQLLIQPGNCPDDILNNSNITELIQSKPGETFQADRYEADKERVLTYLNQYGYLNAKLTGSTIKVYKQKHAADLVFRLHCNQAYTFGPSTIKPDLISERLLRQLAPFQQQQPYNAILLSQYQNTLYGTGLFENIQITPKINLTETDIPIHIDYTPIPRHQYTASLGYNTDIGYNSHVSFTRNLIGKWGQSLDTNLRISEAKQKLDVTLFVPVTHPKQNYFTIGSHIQIESDSTRSFEKIALEYQRSRITPYTDFTWSIINQIERSNFLNDDQRRTKTIIYPEASYTKRFHYTILHGWWQSVIASEPFGLNSLSFAKGLTELIMIFAPEMGSKLLLKNQLGIIWTEPGKKLPASWYFLTGGTYSVRGYGYNQIGAGQINRFLFTGSIEPQFPIYRSIYLTPFIDYGTATPSWRSEPLKYAIGSGLLWESPFGDIQASIATPINRRQATTATVWRFHIGLQRRLH